MYTNVYNNKMEKEATTSISARIPTLEFHEIMMEIRDTKKTISEWIQEAINEKLNNESEHMTELNLQYHKSIIESLEQKKENSAQKKQDLIKLPLNEMVHLKNDKKFLFENPHFITGRISKYRNEFRKKYRISEQDYYQLMDLAEEQSKVNEILQLKQKTRK